MFEYNVCEELIWSQIEAALTEYKSEVQFSEAVYASDEYKTEQVVVLE